MNEVKKKSLLRGVIVSLIAIVFFFAGFGVGYGTGKGASAPEPSESGGLILPESVEENGISLASEKISREVFDEYGIDPAAETAYTVQASIQPSQQAAGKTLAWKLAFANPNSAWAQGKTPQTFVQLSVSAQDSSTVTLTCKAAFGEQIHLVVSVREVPGVSAYVTLDYLQRFRSANITLFNGERDLLGVANFSSRYTVLNYTQKFYFDPNKTFSSVDADLQKKLGAIGYYGAFHVKVYGEDVYTVAQEFEPHLYVSTSGCSFKVKGIGNEESNEYEFVGGNIDGFVESEITEDTYFEFTPRFFTKYNYTASVYYGMPQTASLAELTMSWYRPGSGVYRSDYPSKFITGTTFLKLILKIKAEGQPTETFTCNVNYGGCVTSIS